MSKGLSSPPPQMEICTEIWKILTTLVLIRAKPKRHER